MTRRYGTPALPIPAGSDFPLANLPLGVFSTAGQPKRVGAALGDHVIDLAALGRPGRWQWRRDGAFELQFPQDCTCTRPFFEPWSVPV